MAARGSAAPQLLGAGGLHSLLPRGAEVLLLHLSVQPVRLVLHQCAASGDTCPHGFASGPSLSSPLPEEQQHFLLVRACGSGLPTKALSLLSSAAPWGFWMLWLLLCLPGLSQPSHIWWHSTAFGGTAGRSPSGCCCGSQTGCEQIKSTDEPRLNILLLL